MAPLFLGDANGKFKKNPYGPRDIQIYISMQIMIWQLLSAFQQKTGQNNGLHLCYHSTVAAADFPPWSQDMLGISHQTTQDSAVAPRGQFMICMQALLSVRARVHVGWAGGSYVWDSH